MTFSKLRLVFGLTMAMTSAVVSAQTVKFALTGMQEVPAVTTAASGSGTIMIAPDMSVSGSVTTMGVEGTMAHIHMAAAGQNGPVIVPMMKTGDNVWSIAAGAKLTEAQYQAFKDGNLYVNVHSASNKGGEIRAQLKP
ncbi:CHRD domain-containing protein [Limnohabitans sp.]|uniref:CHRD domain-containing protein n=1 Tax=Limnohabitans sp. TaxID=1907725 RepID=UPI00286F747C|nr:CHRD domain-containing protein [Limnohabitans sp.]